MEDSKTNPDIQEQVDSSDENASDQIINNEEVKIAESTSKNDSIFKRVLENGFDGITTNPNYKLLALLIILLINLSLFFLVGNIGKTFLKNSGILGYFIRFKRIIEEITIIKLRTLTLSNPTYYQ